MQLGAIDSGFDPSSETLNGQTGDTFQVTSAAAVPAATTLTVPTATLDRLTTTTAVVSSALNNTSTYGQSVTFTTTVLNGSTPVTLGAVSFDIDGTPDLSAANLLLYSSGQASFSISALSVAIGTPHHIEALYSGASVFEATHGDAFQTVNPAVPPALTLSTTSLSLGTTTTGTPGPTQTYTVNGSNLTANVAVAAPTGVEIKQDTDATWGTTLTLTPSSGTLATTTIDARISASAALGGISGSITDISAGAAEMNVSVSGLVITVPTVTSPTATSITTTLATLGGNVTSDGGASITARGVVYSLTSANPSPQVDGAGVTNLPTSGTTGAFTINVSGLTPGATYSFTAYATNCAGATYASPVATFTTTGPSGAITTDVPQFSWQPMTGGVSEEFAIGDLTTRQSPPLIVPLSSGTTYQLPASQALTIGHAYVWYIGEVGSSGAIAWSGGTNFNVAPLAAPNQIGPTTPIAPGVGNDTPTFTWSSVPNAVQYAIAVIDALTGATAVYKANVSGTSFTPSQPLLAGHSYLWAVGAEGMRADAGPVAWSSTANFSVKALAAPTAQSPRAPIAALSMGYDTPTFSWSSVPFAVNYNLYVQDAGTGAVVIDNTQTGTSFAPGPVLLAGHSYTWYIGAEAAAGVLGQVSWSEPATFSLAPLVSPSNLVANIPVSTPTLSWNSVAGATSYRLILVDAGTRATVLDNSSITVASYVITGLRSGHHYTWYVAALGAAGAGRARLLEQSGQLRRTLIQVQSPLSSSRGCRTVRK